MTRMRHVACGHLIPKPEFDSRAYTWDPEFTDDDGGPLVMIHCTGCKSDVSVQRFVIVRGSSFPPPAAPLSNTV